MKAEEDPRPEPQEDPGEEPRRTLHSEPGGSDGSENTPLTPLEELGFWWGHTFTNDLNDILPKIGEYTSSDLILMGQFMEHWLGLPPGSGQEAACLFYALGKVARAVSAYREGRLPSPDTLHDLTVYSMMARRIRETGRWP